MTMTINQACKAAGLDSCTFVKMQQAGVIRRFPRKGVVLDEVIKAIPEYKWRRSYSGAFTPLYKECARCLQEMPIDRFRRVKGRSARFGYSIRKLCKRCERASDDPAKTAKYKQRWAQRPENVDARRKRDAERLKDPRAQLDRRIGRVVRSVIGGGSGWREYLPYTMNELREHLEKQFHRGMTWENAELWHIDHITPKSAFSYSSPADPEFQQCWALPNLRPIWAAENVAKGARLEFLL